MKVKLTIENVPAFQATCEAADIKILETKAFGKVTQMIVSFRHPEQLYKAGLYESSFVPQETKTETIQTSKDEPQQSPKGNVSSKGKR